MANKKIKITESQYNRLLNLMVETPFDVMVKNTIKPEDVIVLTWKGSKSKFLVIDNTTGQITMDNIDKGSVNINYRYLMVYTSLDGDDLELRRVNKVKQPEKLKDINSWETYNTKDIINLQVYRNGKLLDTVDPVSPTALKQQNTKGNSNVGVDFTQDVGNYFADILENLTDGKGLNMILNNTELFFCCLSKRGNAFNLEITENKSIPTLNKWQVFSLEIKGDPNDVDNLYELNKDIVKSSDGGKTFSIKFKVFVGTEESEIWVNGGKGFSITNACGDKTEPEGNEPSDEEETPEEETEVRQVPETPEEEAELIEDGEEIYDKILSDPMMQKAFYSQPTFWQAFTAELKGKTHPGNGIITALTLVQNYQENRMDELLGEGFTYEKGRVIQYESSSDIQLNYTGGEYSITAKEKKNIFFKSIENNGLLLQNKVGENQLLEILVTGKTDNENIKDCIVRLLKRDKYGRTTVLVEKQAKLTFINSSGYKSPNQI